MAPQFGLAAALVYQDQTVKDASPQEDRLQLKQFAIPMRDGKVLLNWPTQLLAGYDNKQGRNATLGIGRLVEQARAREKISQLQSRLNVLGLEIATGVLGQTQEWFESASKSGKLKKEIFETWKSDYEEHVNDLDLEPGQKQAGEGLREWVIAQKAFEEGNAKVSESDIQLREILGGKLVFVGFTATGVMADMINTIFGPRTPGVFGHIAVADMVLNQRVLNFAPAWIGPLALLVLGLVSTLTAARFGAGIGASVVVFMLVVYAGTLGVFAFDQLEWIFPMAAPVTSGFSAWLVTTVVMAVITQREKQRVTRQFRARVSPQLVEMLSKNPMALSMGGVEREATILFGDLAGFTSISEVLGGPAVVSTLNLYMGAMTKELTERRAYVNKFLGSNSPIVNPQCGHALF